MSHGGSVLPPPSVGFGVLVPSMDARLAETSDLLGSPVHRSSTARGSGPRHTQIADRMQVAPQPGRSRLRVLDGRRFFTIGDGYSGRRLEVLVAVGSRPPPEFSSPSRWPVRPLAPREGSPIAPPTATSVSLSDERFTINSPRHATHVLVDPRFINRRSSAAAQSCTSRTSLSLAWHYRPSTRVPRSLFAASEMKIPVFRFSRPRSAHGLLEEVALQAFCSFALLSLFLGL